MRLYFIVPRNSGFTQDYLLFSSGGSRTFKRRHLKASSALLPLLFVHSTVPLFSSSLLIFLPNRSRGLRVLQAGHQAIFACFSSLYRLIYWQRSDNKCKVSVGPVDPPVFTAYLSHTCTHCKNRII